MSINWSVPQNDYASHMLQMILGNIWTSVGTSGLNISGLTSATNYLGNMFLIVNSAILTVAVLYLVKIIAEGVIHSNVEGEWLGKNMSGFWSTARIFIFLALIAPVAGGFALSQIFVMFVGNQAIALADNVASVGMQSVLMKGMLQQPITPVSGMEAASSMFKSMVCADVIDSGPNPNLIKLTSSTSMDGTITEEYGGTTGSGLSKEACGGFKFSVPLSMPPAGAASIQAGISTMAQELKSSANQVAKQILQSSGANNGTSGSYTGGSGSTTIADSIVQAAQSYNSAVNGAVNAYYQALKSNLTGSNPSGWSGQVTKYGFATLGSFFLQLTANYQQLEQIANTSPSPIPMNTSGISGYDVRPAESQAQAYITQAESILAQQNNAAGNPQALQGDTSGASLQTVSSSSGGSVFQYAMSTLSSPFLSMQKTLLNEFKKQFSSSTNPVGAIQSFGTYMLTLGVELLAAFLTASAVIGVFGGGLSDAVQEAGMGAIISLVGMLTAIALSIIFPLIIMGLTLAYLIPLIPYIIYTMAVLGFIMALLVAIAGAPFWAALHAVPQGTGFVPDEARQGWKMMLSLFAEPTLIVFGFFFSIVVFDAGAWLINNTFGAAAGAVLARGGTATFWDVLANWFGILTLVAMLVVLYTKVAMWSFSLIHLVPSKALEWGGLNSLSDYGQKGLHGDINTTMSSVHGEVRNTGQSGMKGAQPKGAGDGGQKTPRGVTTGHDTDLGGSIPTIPERNSGGSRVTSNNL